MLKGYIKLGLTACMTVFLAAGCGKTQPYTEQEADKEIINSETEPEETNLETEPEGKNLTEELLLQDAYPGIQACADIDGDGQPEQIQIVIETRKPEVTMQIEMGDGTRFEKSFASYYLPYLTVEDIDGDEDVEILITLKDVTTEETQWVICDYEDGALKELEVSEPMQTKCTDAYLVKDTGVVRIWEKQDKPLYQDYQFEDGQWVQKDRKEFTKESDGREQILTDLLASYQGSLLSETWSREIAVDLNQNGIMDIVQAQDAFFDGNHSYTQIRTWLDGEKWIDFVYEDNFAITQLLAADLDDDGMPELLVSQAVVASNYGGIMLSVLEYGEDGYQEFELPLETPIVAKVTGQGKDAVIRVVESIAPMVDTVKMSDVKYADGEFEITEIDE